MDTIVTLNLFGYVLAIAAGIVLGTMFGRIMLKDLVTLVHGFETRLSSLESAHRAAAAPAPAPAVASHSAAIEHHAVATEKLAAAIKSHTESSNSPQPAAH